MFGRNGATVMRSVSQHFHSSIDDSGQCTTSMAGKNTIAGVNKLSGTTKITGTFDAPGVLCAGRVSATNSTYFQRWGAKISNSAVVIRNAQGKFLLNHNIGHTDYMVTANLVSTGFVGSAIIMNKQASYVEIGIAGIDGNFYNIDFEFICVGRN